MVEESTFSMYQIYWFCGLLGRRSVPPLQSRKLVQDAALVLKSAFRELCVENVSLLLCSEEMARWGSAVVFGKCVVLMLLLISESSSALGAPLFPACFVFGDSLADPGNNNFLPLSLSKANFPYNGMDFPGGQSSGRFCNGRTVVDVLTQLIGFQKFLPAYLDPLTKGSQLLQGVNYASGAGGILNSTGANFIQRLSLETQMLYFEETLARIRALVGSSKQEELVQRALFVLVIGSNDYVNNYLLSDSATKSEYPDSHDYRRLLITSFHAQLTKLYGLGARKVVVTGIGPLGCIPQQLANYILSDLAAPLGEPCISTVNKMVTDYNSALQAMLTALNAQLLDATFVYADSYNTVLRIVQDPSSHGLQVINQGCCGAGPLNGVLPCDEYLGATLCDQRSKFLFWDAFHPSDAANVIMGTGLFNGTGQDVRPINVQQLARV